MEEVRQGYRGEGGQGVGAVQGVVYPLTAPPPGGDWSGEKKTRRGRKVRSVTVEALVAANTYRGAKTRTLAGKLKVRPSEEDS